MTLLRNISRLRPARRAPAADCGCPEGLPERDPDFSAAVTALGAKLARVDGRAEPVEYERFQEAFPAEPRASADIGRLYRLARATTHGFESYARRIAARYDHCPKLLEKVMDGLFHVAKADGVVNTDELAYLERVASLFGMSPLTFRRLKADHLGLRSDDPYRVLNVAPDAPDETVRDAWKRAVAAHHPDRAIGLGLSADLVQQAHARAASINAAFEAVMHERRTGLAVA